MKKIISCFLSILFMVISVFPMTKVSAIDYQAHVAILCPSKEEALNYAYRLCEHEAIIGHPMDVEFTSKVNTENFSTVIHATDIDTNYHIKFHIIPDGGDVSNLDSIIKKCSAVIILYDISDPSLDHIVESKTFFEKDLKKLKDIHSPLTYYINHLQGNWFHRNWWHNSINFVTYGKSRLDVETYNRRRERLNDFTCALEKFFHVDNKWGRGHPDITGEKSVTATLQWISGEAYRSIGEGTVSGKMDEHIKDPKKNICIAAGGVVGGLILLSVGTALAYKVLKQNFEKCC